jgi:flagellar motility protein MotE (MotC chaperone)
MFILYRSAEERTLLETLKTELTNKKEESDRLNERIQILEKDADKNQCSIKTLQKDLESQRSKNDVSCFVYSFKEYLFIISRNFFIQSFSFFYFPE